MAKENSPNRAYLLRCWREGSSAPGGRPHWHFSLEEVLPGRRRQGFADLSSLFDYLRTELDSESEAGASRNNNECTTHTPPDKMG